MRHRVAGTIVWFTGAPGAGKSHLARQVDRYLSRLAVPCTLLDGDDLRQLLVPGHGYDDTGRETFYATLANLALYLAAQGQVVLVAATAHRRAWRDRARREARRFLEVHVATPDATARAQDHARGTDLYAHAVGAVPGRDVPYEPPCAPEVVVEPPDRPRAASRVLAALLDDPSSTAQQQAEPDVALAVVAQGAYVALALRHEAHRDQQAAACRRYGLVPRPELHVTLAYLGEAAVDRLERLCVELASPAIRWELPGLRVIGLGGAVGGAEPRVATDELLEDLQASPRVLWWSVERSDALIELHGRVAIAVDRAGLSSPHASPVYYPHVTLGAAGPGASGSAWDTHSVPKLPGLRESEARPGDLALATAHLTTSRLHPESLVSFYRW